MKTKIKFLGILFPMACIMLASFLLSGCGSGPEFESVEQYENGEFNPGWLFEGMTEEQMKNYIDHMIESEAKKTAIEYFKQKYVISSTTKTETNIDPSSSQSDIDSISPSAGFEFGTVAVSNETRKRLRMGAEWISSQDAAVLATLTEKDRKKIKQLEKKYVNTGLLSPSWYVEKKSTIFPKLLPGKYRTWFKWGKKIIRSDIILDIGLQTTWFLDREVNGSFVVEY